jgi:hypothetical protein
MRHPELHTGAVEPHAGIGARDAQAIRDAIERLLLQVHPGRIISA